MKRIGYFGGTFDPIHNGHIVAARAAKEKMFLDEVCFIPSGISYQKTDVASAVDRLNMVTSAIQPYADFSVSGMDITRVGNTYTVDTVKEIVLVCPSDTTPYWIMGADAFMDIESYKDFERILSNIEIIIVDRGDKRDKIKEQYLKLNKSYKCKGFYYVDLDYPTSSTDIKQLIKTGRIDEANIPESVARYIKECKLYNIDKCFDAERATKFVVDWIRNKMNSFNMNSKAVIGISGGKDSTVMAALCVKALGKDRVIGVRLPNGRQYDIDDARRVCDILDIQSYEININVAYDDMIAAIENRVDTPTEACAINLAPRIRMAYLYAVAQTIGNAFVVNTCNLSEDWVGYSTWHGDSAGDFSPLAKYTSEEVVAIGDYLGLPSALTHKTPADGLCGKTDEANLGFTYHELNEYIRGRAEPRPEIKELIDRKHEANLFKLQPLDTCPYYEHKE
jgi:NAD+ synthase